MLAPQDPALRSFDSTASKKKLVDLPEDKEIIDEEDEEQME